MICATLLAGFLLKAQCLDPWVDYHQYASLCYNDLQPLFGVRGVLDHVFPYIHGRLVGGELLDGAIEYPVLTGVFMWASGLWSADADAYLVHSALLLAPFGILAAYLLMKLTGWRALMFAAAPAIVLYAFHNWDLLVVAASVAGFYAWSKGRVGWAGILFGVGASLKMYPLFFLAPLFLERMKARDPAGAGAGVAGGVGAFAAINLPFLLSNPPGWLATYEFHQLRGADFNSIWHWATPSLGPDQLNPLTAGLVALFFTGILGVGWIKSRRYGVYPFVQACGAMLATFLLFNKVHSPQYTLWILPFFVLTRIHWGWLVAYSLADLGVYVGIFRWFYDLGARGVDDGLAKDVLLAGLWGRAALLLVLVGVFMAMRPAEGLEAPVTPDQVASHPPPNVTTGETVPAEG